ncbi:MAG TPA: signal recognition particle-docking protein FtsY [Geomonas sp.]|nr:signal recognition particle-docking protein FtsY [Geomonas sp.]
MTEENKGFFKGLLKKLGMGPLEEPEDLLKAMGVPEEESREEVEEAWDELSPPEEKPAEAPAQRWTTQSYTPTPAGSSAVPPSQDQYQSPVVAEPAPVTAPQPEATLPAPVPPEPVVPAPVAPVSVAEPAAKPSFFERLKRSLSKTHESIVGRVDALLLGKKQIDTDTLEELEEILITADLGVKTTVDLVRTLEQRLKRNELQDGAALKKALKEEIQARLLAHAAPLVVSAKTPFVILVIGVNGVGKTTTIGKLAARYAGEGKKVLLAAADTFRAAAAEQLELWANRVGADIVRHKEGADPSAVVFDACKAALARRTEVLIIDTAGRMHTKVNLMEEMKKIRRVLTREIPDAPHETLLVLDAATGQNALSQAKLFKEAADVSGVVLTKLDGSAKGGIVVAVSHEYSLPVRFIGVGESVEDLREFDPVQFVEALFE